MNPSTRSIDLLFSGYDDDLFDNAPLAATEELLAPAVRKSAIDPLEDLLEQGLLHFEQGDLPAALQAFRSATRQSPGNAEAWNDCGIVCLAMAAFEAACDDFNLALACQPNHPQALSNRGRAKQAQGEFAGALADFSRALAFAEGPFRAAVYHNRGTLRQATGDLSGALADFDRALDLDPVQVNCLINRGVVRKELDDLTGAMADLNRALDLAPKSMHAQVLHARGGVRVLQNDFTGAIDDYNQALRLEPDYVVAYISRGNARYHCRDPRGVVDYLAAFRLDAQAAAAELVSVLHGGSQRDVDEVLANCDRHLRINDRDAIAHARRAMTLVLLGRPAEAAYNLSRFEELVPEGLDYLHRLLAAAREHIR